MKVTISTTDVKKVLLIKADHIELMKVDDNKLLISNGDHDPKHKVMYGAIFEGDDKFSYTVDAISFFGAINGLKDNDNIVMEKKSDNGKIIMGSDGSKLKFRLAAESNLFDYSNVPMNGTEFKVVSADFFDVYKKTTYCASVGDTRQALSGINFKFISDGEIEMVATDGKRLAINMVKYEGKKHDKDFIVEPSFLDACMKSWQADSNPQITFEINSNAIEMTNGNTIIRNQLIDAQFPDYKAIIDGNFKDTNKMSFTFVASDMERTLGKINFGSEIVRNIFKLCKNVLEVKSSSSTCDAEEELTVTNVNGVADNFEVAFGDAVISQFIKANKDMKEITMVGNGNASPFLISTETSKYIMMPMKVR